MEVAVGLGAVAETDVKAFGCREVKVIAASGTTASPDVSTAPPDVGIIMGNMLA